MKKYTLDQLDQKLAEDLNHCTTLVETNCCKAFAKIEIVKTAYTISKSRQLNKFELDIALKHGFLVKQVHQQRKDVALSKG